MDLPHENSVQAPEVSLSHFSRGKKAILVHSAELVVQRAKVEKYRTNDLGAAKDAYSALGKERNALTEELRELSCSLKEVEAYSLAHMADQLRGGLSGFDLMSANYKPVYEALCGFADRLPSAETVDASVIGHLMNQVKMGYYPTDPENITHILRGIRFPEGVNTNLFDPCCGCGKALRQIAQGNGCFTYGVELDQSRAEEAQKRLHRVGIGSYFHSRISHEAFHLLFLNPPYISVLDAGGERVRNEKKFLIESPWHLMRGGLLIYVIPYYRLSADICRILADGFEDLSVWRFTDREFQKFRQVAVMGIRAKNRQQAKDTRWLEQYATRPDLIPSITELEAGRYALPAVTKTVGMFRGEKFDEKELEQQLRRSDSFSKLLSRKELDSGEKRPLLPLSIGQVGLIGGSGMINGLIDCDTPHIIKGRIVKEKRVETEEKFSTKGLHMATEVREVVSNKMIFNVLTPKGFKALT